MMYTNNGGTTFFNLGQLKQMYPNISFSPNTPSELGYTEFTPPVATPVLTSAQVQDELTYCVQNHLDSKAREYNYDSILSAVSYASAVNKFQSEGLAFLAWRSAVWTKCYEILGAVQADLRPIPTKTQLIAELPVYVAP